jgi:DNA-binding MarR family transcriptional regulator
MDALPDDLATLWFLIRRVSGLMDRAGESVFRAALGVSLAQFLVLSVVDAYPGDLNQQAIANRLGLTKGTVSKQIENAIAAGLLLVTPSPASRREKIVSLTAKGTALVRKGDAVFADARRTGMPVIPSADMAATLATLGAINEALETY